MCRIACAPRRPPSRRSSRSPSTHIYICGLKGMESGVDEAFADVCRHAGLDWAALKPEMRASGRYHVETYWTRWTEPPRAREAEVWRAEPRAGAGASRSPLLSEIGAIMRQARAKRGMTRKSLAALSRTSERYLAQIESGEGNPTVLVLDAVARDSASRCSIFCRCRKRRTGRPGAAPAPPERAGAQAVDRFLDSGDADPAAEARGRRIALVGLRGAGKTTLGQRWRLRLDCRSSSSTSSSSATMAPACRCCSRSTDRAPSDASDEREALEKVVAVKTRR